MTHSGCILFAAALVLGLGGCGLMGPSAAPDTAGDYDYRQKHPITVAPRFAVLQLSGGPVLSPDDLRRLDGFAGEFLRRGDNVLEISVRAATADDAAARSYGQAIANRLLDAGLKMRELRLQLVLDEPAMDVGSAFLRFGTSTASVPECYEWSEGERNAPHPNFGCSVQHNLGAMVANPRDLVERGAINPTLGARGGDAIDKMNQGQPTWSSPLPWSATSQPSGSGGQ
jgi:pilus assembly protein CpaD